MDKIMLIRSFGRLTKKSKSRTIVLHSFSPTIAIEFTSDIESDPNTLPPLSKDFITGDPSEVYPEFVRLTIIHFFDKEHKGTKTLTPELEQALNRTFRWAKFTILAGEGVFTKRRMFSEKIHQVDIRNLELFDAISRTHQVASNAKNNGERDLDSTEFLIALEDAKGTLAMAIDIIGLYLSDEVWNAPTTHFKRGHDQRKNDFSLSAKIRSKKSHFEFSFGYVYSVNGGMDFENYLGWYAEMPMHFSMYLNKMSDDFFQDIAYLNEVGSVFIPNHEIFKNANATKFQRGSRVTSDLMELYYSMSKAERDSLKEDFVIGTIRLYIGHTDTLRELISDGMDALDNLYSIHKRLARHRYTENDHNRDFENEQPDINLDELWTN